MKVCVISTPIFALGNAGLVGYGGLEHLAWQQAKGLAARGHEVFLVAPEGSSCPGTTIIPIGPPGQWGEHQAFNSYWPKLLEVDVVVDHSWQKFSYMLKAEGRMPKTSVLGWLHAPVRTMYQSLPPGVEKPCFVCISEDQRTHFESLFERPARVAKNGIDLDFYKPIEGVKRTNRYLFLARFSSIKGPDLAIEACRKADVGLDLVGDTSITNEPDFFKKCKDMCDGEQIRMVGPAKRGECVWWFSRAYCMLHPNQRFREPLGLAPLEAQAGGCPVIAFNYGAMRETVKHGETGFLVDSIDQMTNLIKTDAASSINRQRCREWVAENFSEQRMIDRVDELIHEAKEGGW